LTAGLLDEQGQRPVTEFLNNFLVKPKFPTRPKAADAGKLGLLIASFTDRVEPFNYIAEYLKNSLLSLVNRKTFIGDLMYGNGWKLEGLSRTRLGASLIDELMTRLNQSSASVVRNCVILGYNLFGTFGKSKLFGVCASSNRSSAKYCHLRGDAGREIDADGS